MKDTDFEFEKRTKSISFSDGERLLLRELMRRVRARSKSARQMADPSKLLKELMGLVDYGLLTDEDRRYISESAANSLSLEAEQTVACVFCGKPSEGGLCAGCKDDLTSEPKMVKAKLDDLPYGAIQLNAEGTIVAYNKAEYEMSRVSHRQAIGKNFFTDIAPCADIQEFHGRYDAFLKGERPSEEFRFKYKFDHASVHVLITFIRLDSHRVLVTAKKDLKAARQKQA